MPSKSMVDEVKQLVQNRGGKLLGAETKTKFSITCSEGHKFSASLNSLRKNAWCLDCAFNKIFNHEAVKGIVKMFGGELLSPESQDFQPANLSVKCSCGNTHQTSVNKVINGESCPACG